MHGGLTSLGGLIAFEVQVPWVRQRRFTPRLCSRNRAGGLPSMVQTVLPGPSVERKTLEQEHLGQKMQDPAFLTGHCQDSEVLFVYSTFPSIGVNSAVRKCKVQRRASVPWGGPGSAMSQQVYLRDGSFVSARTLTICSFLCSRVPVTASCDRVRPPSHRPASDGTTLETFVGFKASRGKLPAL